jgi:Leucine-rich repeat (LRR) protein
MGIIINALLLFLACLSLVHADVSAAERTFLVNFYNSIQGSTNAAFTATWDVSNGASDPCTNSWAYITCNGGNTAVTQLVYTDASSSFVLAGTIPTDINALSSLTTLRITNQALNGTIPESLTRITTITDITLSGNNLKGTIPSSALAANGWGSLSTLDLNFNSLTGTLPVNSFFLDGLVTLDVGQNHLSGVLTNLTELTSVQSLRLDYNSFSGTLPAALYTTLTLLTTLDLGENSISGTIPTNVGTLSKLTTFCVASNSMSGSIPSSLYTMTDLIELELSHNSFTGSFSEDLGSITAGTGLLKLTKFAVGSNSFTGAIPTSFTALTKLDIVDIAYNLFARTTLPSSLWTSPTLQSLEAGGNYWDGTIPEALFDKTTLTGLNLERTYLSGTISPLFAQLTGLQKLYLQHSSFTGTIPFQMKALTNLRVLNFDDNSMTGVVHLCELQESETLYMFNVMNNDFNCYSACWTDEVELIYEDGDSDSNVPSCSACPAGKYQQAYDLDSDGDSKFAGGAYECVSCPTGKFSEAIGANSESTCIPCPNYGDAFQYQLNDQCFDIVGIAKTDYVGGDLYDQAAFVFALFGGMIGGAIFGYFVWTKREKKAVQAISVPFWTLIVKFSLYGFLVIAEFTIAMALFTTETFTKYGTVLVVFRMLHMPISGYIISKAYQLSDNTVFENAHLLNEGKYVHYSKYEMLIDKDFLSLHDPWDQGSQMLLNLLCLFEVGYLQFLPWNGTEYSASHQGWPDANTFMLVTTFKSSHWFVGILVMSMFVANCPTNQRGQGIAGMIGLYIGFAILITAYNLGVEPYCCAFKAVTRDVTNDPEAPTTSDADKTDETRASGSWWGNVFGNSEKQEGESAKSGKEPRVSAFVEAGTAYERRESEFGMPGTSNNNPISALKEAQIEAQKEEAAISDKGADKGDGEDAVQVTEKSKEERLADQAKMSAGGPPRGPRGPPGAPRGPPGPRGGPRPMNAGTAPGRGPRPGPGAGPRGGAKYVPPGRGAAGGGAKYTPPSRGAAAGPPRPPPAAPTSEDEA